MRAFLAWFGMCLDTVLLTLVLVGVPFLLSQMLEPEKENRLRQRIETNHETIIELRQRLEKYEPICHEPGP